MAGIIQNMKDLKDFWNDPWVKYVAIFGVIFLVSFTFLFALGLVPSELRNGTSVLDELKMQTLESVSGVSEPIQETPEEEGEEPLHLTIPNTDVDIVVQNPNTRDNVLLNEYLTKGTVRYPDSALLGSGNTLIFGHSSNAAVVNNDAYKALNGIEDLKRDDTIYVDSATTRYVYKVLKVETVNADEQYVNFKTEDAMLTLSTCNSFGKKESRHVVTAILDEKISLPL